MPWQHQPLRDPGDFPIQRRPFNSRSFFLRLGHIVTQAGEALKGAQGTNYALTQPAARDIRIVEVSCSNPQCSAKPEIPWEIEGFPFREKSEKC